MRMFTTYSHFHLAHPSLTCFDIVILQINLICAHWYYIVYSTLLLHSVATRARTVKAARAGQAGQAKTGPPFSMLGWVMVFNFIA